MAEQGAVLRETHSVCPACLKRISARRVLRGGNVYLEKACPEHGFFSTVVWRGYETYGQWISVCEGEPEQNEPQAGKGCPYDCGLCADHRQSTCCVLLEVTQACNQKCPVCFADSGNGTGEPSLSDIQAYLRAIFDRGITFLHLTGGEPTVRGDLPEIISMAKDIGFPYIQLNTNGLRLAEEPGYARMLAQAGLSCVFMQFDGTRDDIYKTLRGRPLLSVKDRAVENCGRQALGVVLVPTLMPGVNTDDIGGIIRYGLDRSPAVKGVHFQPVSYLGRYPETPGDEQRITLPEVLREIEAQTEGAMKAENFIPSSCYHELCNFHGDFVIMNNKKLMPLSFRQEQPCCCGGTEDAVKKNQDFVAKRWAGQYEDSPSCSAGEDMGEWEAFAQHIRTHSFAVTGMLFQDCWNIDVERLKKCSLHVFRPDGADGSIIPFCAYYLTDSGGNRLYSGGAQ